MQAVVLWFGLLWPEIAPLMIAPGMTPEQVEAILGRPDIYISTGAVGHDRDSWKKHYLGWGVRVYFNGDKVVSVSRRKR